MRLLEREIEQLLDNFMEPLVWSNIRRDKRVRNRSCRVGRQFGVFAAPSTSEMPKV